MTGNNVCTWLTVPAAFPIPQRGLLTCVLLVECLNRGENDAGKVLFSLSNAPAGISFISNLSPIDLRGGKYIASVGIDIGSGVPDGASFTITATPVKADGTTNDGTSTSPLAVKAYMYAAGTGGDISYAPSFVTTPADPKYPPKCYTLQIPVKNAQGQAIDGAMLTVRVTPSLAKLYDLNGDPLPLLPENNNNNTYVIYSNGPEGAQARLATVAGVHAAQINVQTTVQGTNVPGSVDLYFATTPDSVDMMLGWGAPEYEGPTTPGGCIPIGSGTYSLHVTVPDGDQDRIRFIVLNDKHAYLYNLSTSAYILLPCADLDDLNRFTYFSQDKIDGNVMCSVTSTYCAAF